MTPVFTITPAAQATADRFHQASRDYKKTTEEWSKGLAKQFIADIQQTLESQRFDAVPLTPGWARRKARQGLDPRVLIATRNYFDSFQAEKVEPGIYGVSCSQKKFVWAELGTAKSPARRHVADVLARNNLEVSEAFVQKLLGGK